MDIAGAKALKQRLGGHGADEAPAAARAKGVPADAPPVYQWTGVSKAPPEAPSAGSDEEISPGRASLFRRLGLSFR
jgi:hypothetical protein